MEVLLLHLLTQIYLYLHYTISTNWGTLIWKSYGLFQSSGQGNFRTFFPIHDLGNDLGSDLVEVLPVTMTLMDVIEPAKLVQKAELSGKELIVTTYCTHLAGMHWVMKWLLMLRSFS